VALRIIGVLNEGTAEALDTLERATTNVLDKGGLSTAEQVDLIPKFLRSMRSIARRLTEEKAAVEELRRLSVDVDPAVMGVVDRARLSSALTAQERLIDTHSETANLALDALGESLRVAQKSSNSYAYMLTILGGVTVPVALALGYVQSFQLTGHAANTALYCGIGISAALLTLFNRLRKNPPAFL
jgi:hypothetical protein